MTSAELLQRLKTIGIKHPELCKALGEYVCLWGGSGRSSVCLWDCSIPNSQAARNTLVNSCQVFTISFLRLYKNTFCLNRLAKLYVSRVKLPQICVQVQHFCSACLSWLCRSSESLQLDLEFVPRSYRGECRWGPVSFWREWLHAFTWVIMSWWTLPQHLGLDPHYFQRRFLEQGILVKMSCCPNPCES